MYRLQQHRLVQGGGAAGRSRGAGVGFTRLFGSYDPGSRASSILVIETGVKLYASRVA